MFQEPEFSLKRDISLILAVEAAGFKITNSKSVETEDGFAWHATLAHGRTKIAKVSNGGTGGEDDSHFHAADDAERSAHKLMLETLFKLPQVVEVLRKNALYDLNLKQQFDRISDSDHAAARDDIARTQPAVTTENVEYLVGYLATASKLTGQIKRALKTKMVFVKKGDDQKGGYSWYTAPDTPANRALAQEKQNGNIDYFAADLFAAVSKEGAK